MWWVVFANQAIEIWTLQKLSFQPVKKGMPVHSKGQLILKCPFFVKISALASFKRGQIIKKGTLYH